MKRSSSIVALLHLVVAGTLLMVTGCASRIYPVTTGYHVPGDALVAGGRAERYVVWANHPGVTHLLTSTLLQRGHTVVERAHVERLLAEQRFRLVHTPDDDLLRVGAMVGATQVIFATLEPVIFGSVERKPTRLSVNLRSVQVESGTVQWVGVAVLETGGGRVITNPEQGGIGLARWAFLRATCPTEHGWQWEEQTDATEGGCLAPGPGRE